MIDKINYCDFADDKIRVKYSIINDEKSTILLLRGKGKLKPSLRKKTYEEDINFVKNKFNKLVNIQIEGNEEFTKDFLFNIDISSKNIHYDKWSFIKYDIFLKLKDNRVFDILNKDNLHLFIMDINKLLLMSLNGNFDLKVI